MIIEVFSRPGCHLCDEAKKVIAAAAARHSFDFIERNVEEREEWESRFGHEIPVVFIDGRKAFKYKVPPRELERYFKRNESKAS